jgi:hypothetical protein
MTFGDILLREYNIITLNSPDGNFTFIELLAAWLATFFINHDRERHLCPTLLIFITFKIVIIKAK